jgi:hypothetical protein
VQELQWFVMYSMRTAFCLLLNKKYYDNYCYHGGKTNEHYFVADLTTVQVLHSSYKSLYEYIYVRKYAKY